VTPSPRLGLLSWWLLAALTAPADAQVDTLPADSIRADSAPAAAHADSLRRDSATLFLPTMPPSLVPGPLPWGARHVFNADSLLFTGALTLGDVLVRVPGVYVARAGYYGQAEPLFYGGRGAAGIELYWDGVPYVPLGRDSVFLDVARIPLAPLERIEVLTSPDRVRVHLVTARPADTQPRTLIGIATGRFEFANYRAGFSRRWRSGFGLSLLADYNNIEGDPEATTDFRGTDLWLKLDFVPRPTLGASFQVVRSSWRRDGRSNVVDAWSPARRDDSFQAFVGSRADGLGWRLHGIASRARSDGDSTSAPDELLQGQLELSHRGTRAAAALTGRLASDHRRRELEGQAGWVLLPWLDLAGSARLTGHPGGRDARRLAASVGLRLPLGFAARGEVVRSWQLAAPALAADTLQRTDDWLGAIRWDSRWGTIEVARAERDPFHPLGFPRGIRPLAELGRTPRTRALLVNAAIRPLPGLTLSTAFSDPFQGGGDFDPPRHARYAATFFSKFWRVYRSGVFALRAEVAAESWSTGLGGVARDSLGQTSQAPLAGATFLDLQVDIQIVGVTIFWQMRNAAAMRGGYVSGLTYPRVVQFYGARWAFTN
jgi:hypothetical protein